MAIQLNERDYLIFKFIEEHQVLLEKHIAWFISCDDKPVLIRDRLRKLFYLDYLLCQRHGSTLPWWTTPTKPLVYTLSPMSRGLVNSQEELTDLGDTNVQRHLLEVANLRMLFLVEKKEGLIQNFVWTTMLSSRGGSSMLDAKVSFDRGGTKHAVGILNHPASDLTTLRPMVEKTLADEGIDHLWIVSRDEAHQQSLQEVVAQMGAPSARRCAFATHQELYKSGVVKSRWQSAEGAPHPTWAGNQPGDSCFGNMQPSVMPA